MVSVSPFRSRCVAIMLVRAYNSQPVFLRVLSFPVCSHSLPSSVGVTLSGHGSWILQPSSPALNYLYCLFISPSPPHPFLCPPQPLSLMDDHGSLVDMCVSIFLPVILLLTGLQRAPCFCRASSWCLWSQPRLSTWWFKTLQGIFVSVLLVACRGSDAIVGLKLLFPFAK